MKSPSTTSTCMFFGRCGFTRFITSLDISMTVTFLTSALFERCQTISPKPKPPSELPLAIARGFLLHRRPAASPTYWRYASHRLITGFQGYPIPTSSTPHSPFGFTGYRAWRVGMHPDLMPAGETNEDCDGGKYKRFGFHPPAFARGLPADRVKFLFFLF
jgi:hypothetical protein